MIFVGIDDTDTAGSPGTNQVARGLMRRIAGRWQCLLILRHQLLQDPRVPCTTKNGSASMVLMPLNESSSSLLIDELRAGLQERFVGGSDPGLCVAATVPEAVIAFGRRCQRRLVDQQAARELAANHALHLEGLGGTEGGVIGALAAVGLAAGGSDGRVVHIADWPDDLTGLQEIDTVQARGVEVRCLDTGQRIISGRVDVGKHLRPSYRHHKIILYVRPGQGAGEAVWQGVRLT